MSNRFMLTAAGTASVAVSGMASAELVDFNVVYDSYIGEASWQSINSASSVIASAFVSGGLIVNGIDTASSNFTFSGSFSAGYNLGFQLDLAAGDYTLVMGDTWGDGWAWNGIGGGIGVGGPGTDDAFFAFSSGSTASGSFTVVPAPGALALLGLAGVAGRRRRG